MVAEHDADADAADAHDAGADVVGDTSAESIGRTAAVVGWVDRDRTAHLAGLAVWPVALVVLVYFGREQWFARDDWAFLLTRRAIGNGLGFDDMLMLPQDGHWMMWPLLVFRGLYEIFGLGSYWPYLIVLWITHFASVALARAWMLRFGVSAWIATLMTALLLLFGAGWENMVFAVQICYNMSLIAFLGHLLLADHDGSVDRRDYAGAALGVISVSSSGFGPFFLFGTLVLLLLRRRWRAAMIAVVPQTVALGWWWLTWGADPAGDQGSASPSFVIDFLRVGANSTLGSMTGVELLAGAGCLLCIAVATWPGTPRTVRIPTITLLVTATVMYAGVGSRREIFGIGAAGWSRYQYMAAMLIAPVVAFGLDQAHRFATWAKWVPRLLLVYAVSRNTLWLADGANFWAQQAADDRRIFSLVAGSPKRFEVPIDRSMTAFSPDVRVYDLEELVADGAITRRTPMTAAEELLVDQALGLVPTTVPTP
ncbi:MAG TPA: hypothetical protein VMM60_09820 [Ilumatobacter sp.]|nr:hypothetical protein [Ilumatobacter sp.]